MSQVYLFALASQQNRWLSVRQSVVAGNVANANTPGYVAQDVTPFAAAVSDVSAKMTATDSRHLGLAEGANGAPRIENRPVTEGEITHSGNSVNLEQELIKAGEINRTYRLNTNVMKSFHRMMLASMKG